MVFLYFKTLCNLNTKIDLFWKNLPPPSQGKPGTVTFPADYLFTPNSRWGDQPTKGEKPTYSLPLISHEGLSKLMESGLQQASAFRYQKANCSAYPMASSILKTNHLHLLLSIFTNMNVCRAEKEFEEKYTVVQYNEQYPNYYPVLWSYPLTKKPS